MRDPIVERMRAVGAILKSWAAPPGLVRAVFANYERPEFLVLMWKGRPWETLPVTVVVRVDGDPEDPIAAPDRDRVLLTLDHAAAHLDACH